MRIRVIASVVLSTFVLTLTAVETSEKKGGFLDSLFKRSKKTNDAGATVDLSGLTTAQISSGLREAIEKGLRSAIQDLGRTNGFLTNLNARILVPDELKTVERTLRTLKQGAVVDEFERTMNRAAEKAVPAGAEVLGGALKDMTIENAAQLLTSKSPTAVTDFFRAATTNQLSEKFLPIIKEATGQTGVTSAYKQILAKASFGSVSLASYKSLDIDQYVTQKTLDGLFLMIGEEEKKIRENPRARTTELLQKVFGAIQK